MDFWHVRGGNRLSGSLRVQGSKNASLPILAAAIVCPVECRLYNLPRLRDVDAALRILRHLGCTAQQNGSEAYIDSRSLSRSSIPSELMEEMRSSVIFMGALLSRCGQARLSPPGGCQLGKRPIDLHLKALRQLGAVIEEEGGEIRCTSSGLRGTDIFLPFPSVGATENILLTACGAEGKTTVRGAAREPEIRALADFLRAMGASIYGDGSECIVIDGFRAEKRLEKRICSDRIAAATYCCACAACGGSLELRDVYPEQFSTVLHFLNRAGCDIINGTHCVRLRSDGRLKAVGDVKTSAYPGFPTDAQPVLMAALLKAEGRSRISDSIFENRFRQVPELIRLGAHIEMGDSTAVIDGAEVLRGGRLTATDLRGGAAMIIAALSAQGESLITDSGHVRRGYEDFDSSLRSLGADIYLEAQAIT